MWSLAKPSEEGDLSADAADAAGCDASRDCVVIGSSFEETYPRHEFSELVRLGLALGRWIARRRRLLAAKPEVPPAASPGQITAAE